MTATIAEAGSRIKKTPVAKGSGRFVKAICLGG